jgi:hypothetical protein
MALALLAAPATAATSAGGGFERGSEAPATGAPTIPEALLNSLLLLSDDACEVRYVPGSLDRAAHVEPWLRELATGAAKRTRVAAPLVALVLPRDEWQQARLPCAYGVPCAAGDRVLALPAAGDSGTVALWRGILGALPALEGQPLMGTAEEASSLVPADAYGSFLASRDLVRAAGFAADEPWVTDLLAHAVALDAARQSRSGRGEALAAFWEVVRGQGPPASRPGAPLLLAGELFRQARIFLAAQALLGSDGRLPAKVLRKMQEKGSGVLRAADVRASWPEAMSNVPVPDPM